MRSFSSTWAVALSALLTASCSDGEHVDPYYRLTGPSDAAWSQWGRTGAHEGMVQVVAEPPARALGSVLFDPFIPAERAEEGGSIVTHYQSPLVDADGLFMEIKSGAYRACSPPGSGTPAPCGSASWATEVWNEARFAWVDGALVEQWRFPSDWTPEPDDGTLEGWEPVFHAALDGDYVVVPGAGGSVFVLRREDGVQIARAQPFADLDPSTHVAGPLTVAPDGSVYYDVIALDPTNPWTTDVRGGWLVRVAPDGAVTKVSFADLVPGAPAAGCTLGFDGAELPWPPSPDAVAPQGPCGTQRPALNVAPAIAADGTVHVVSRAHFSSAYGYLVAVGADLSPRWASSLRGRLDDGCGSALLPPDGQPGGCRAGARPGVDPATNEPPAGQVLDLSTASPVVAPDGTVLIGVFTLYNYARGHLLQFSAAGSFLASYDFGWDVTPAIYTHDGTYSVVTKDNHYDVGSYCSDPAHCPPAPGGPYQITQLDAHLAPEWSFTSTNELSCAPGPGGKLGCVADHPHGFEWCVNAPAVDAAGTVFAGSEDGALYAIPQGGKTAVSLFLRESLGAAYTPLSIDASGRVYAENLGTLFAAGTR